MKVIQLTSFRALLFIIWITVFGCCFSLAGCVAENDDDDTDSIIVVSNVFTPNGEGSNIFFEVKSKNVDDVVSLKIYTRAGVLVFSIEAEYCVWDGCSLSGQPMVAGTYQYTAEIIDSSPKISKCGFVHLYR
jgi:gliding motility-associated-like protein